MTTIAERVAADMYQRPDREAIRRQVESAQRAQGTPSAPAAGVKPQREASDVLGWFSAHVRAALGARGWSLGDLSARTGDATGNLSQALNGTKCPLAIAGRIADALDIPFAEMVVPYTCRTCAGKPPKGFSCLECGTEARA